MKSWRFVRISSSLALVTVLASGCGSGRDVHVYEPGVYKGAAYTTKYTPELQAKLQERCLTGQSDR